MPSPQSVPSASTSGAANQLAPVPAGANQGVEELHILGEEISSDEEMGTESPTTPGKAGSKLISTH